MREGKKSRHNSLPTGYTHRDEFYDFYYDDNYEDFMQIGYDFDGGMVQEQNGGFEQGMVSDFVYGYSAPVQLPQQQGQDENGYMKRTRSRSVGNNPTGNLWEGNNDYAFKQQQGMQNIPQGSGIGVGGKRSSFLTPIEEFHPMGSVHHSLQQRQHHVQVDHHLNHSPHQTHNVQMDHHLNHIPHQQEFRQQRDRTQQNQQFSQSYNQFETQKYQSNNHNRFRHSDEVDYNSNSGQSSQKYGNRLRHSSHDGFQTTGHAFRNRDIPPNQMYGSSPGHVRYPEQPPSHMFSSGHTLHPVPTTVYQTPKQEYHSPPQSHMYHKFEQMDDDVEMGENKLRSPGGHNRQYDNFELTSASNNVLRHGNSSPKRTSHSPPPNEENGTYEMEGVPPGFKLNASKSPIMECIVFAALMKWGIEIIVHELQPLNIVFRITKFDYFYFASDAVCAKPNPGSEESRLRAIKRYFNNFPLKKQRNNNTHFEIEVKSQFVEKVDNVISFVRNMYFS